MKFAFVFAVVLLASAVSAVRYSRTATTLPPPPPPPHPPPPPPAAAAEVAKGSLRVPSKCLVSGGITESDISQLVDDTYNLAFHKMINQKNGRVLCCVLHEKVYPKMTLLRHVALLGGFPSCYPTEGYACKDAGEVLRCLVEQAGTLIFKVAKMLH